MNKKQTSVPLRQIFQSLLKHVFQLVVVIIFHAKYRLYGVVTSRKKSCTRTSIYFFTYQADQVFVLHLQSITGLVFTLHRNIFVIICHMDTFVRIIVLLNATNIVFVSQLSCLFCVYVALISWLRVFRKLQVLPNYC